VAIDKHFTGRSWFLASVLVVVTFVAYQPIWHAGFIWDDNDHLTANPAMTAPHGLRMIWSSLAVSRYYPLTLTTFWIERRLWGLNPLPYHLVNVALHALNGVLVLFLLRRLRVPGAGFAALAWALHPVNVESAAWITELKNTQSAVFFFLGLLCFFRFEAGRERRWYALALVCGLAAMLSKPSTVGLPVILLLCVWWERRKCHWGDIARIAPFFGLSLGMSALAVVEQHGEILKAGTPEWKLGMADRLVIAGKAVWFYAAKLLWPVGLAFVYPRWNVQASALSSWLPLAALIAAVTLLCVWRRQPWARAGLFGLACFVIALLPILGFFDLYYFRYSFVADHFQYLAGAGFIALAASAGTTICAQTGRPSTAVGRVAALAILTALTVLTWNRAYAYKDNEALWRDTLAKNPGCWLAHNNLGLQLLAEGKVQEALSHAEQAVQSQPDFFEGHNNLALALAHAGWIQDAIAQYEQALRIKPDSAEAYNNLGNALLEVGRFQDAIEHYEQAVRIRPDYAEAHNNLGNTLLQAGRFQDAMGHLEQALRIKPDYAMAHNNLGFALAHLGRIQEAIGHYERALQIQPNHVQALNNLAGLLATIAPAEGGDPIRAVTLAQRACQLTGNQVAEFIDTLAGAYAAANRFNDAIAAAQKAVELARSTGQTQLADEIETRLALYRDVRTDRQLRTPVRSQSVDVPNPTNQ
jgi:tetratricopeptide (TPR) repeat protein